MKQHVISRLCDKHNNLFWYLIIWHTKAPSLWITLYCNGCGIWVILTKIPPPAGAVSGNKHHTMTTRTQRHLSKYWQSLCRVAPGATSQTGVGNYWGILGIEWLSLSQSTRQNITTVSTEDSYLQHHQLIKWWHYFCHSACHSIITDYIYLVPVISLHRGCVLFYLNCIIKTRLLIQWMCQIYMFEYLPIISLLTSVLPPTIL